MWKWTWKTSHIYVVIYREEGNIVLFHPLLKLTSDISIGRHHCQCRHTKALMVRWVRPPSRCISMYINYKYDDGGTVNAFREEGGNYFVHIIWIWSEKYLLVGIIANSHLSNVMWTDQGSSSVFGTLASQSSLAVSHELGRSSPHRLLRMSSWVRDQIVKSL